MNALLICPDARPGVPVLAAGAPLACCPLLGESPLGCWLEHLAQHGATHVRVLASDRPAAVAELTGDGSRWGLQIEVLPADCELSPADARAQFRAGGGQWLPAPLDATAIDRLPGLPEHPLFESYAGWFAALAQWLPRARTPLRVGVRELQPGVWAGRHTQIAPGAELRAPCWLGTHVRIGPDTIIGPHAIIEDRVWVDRGVEIAGSAIGPDTFVGELCELHHSLVWGRTLVNWRDSTCVEVPDSFLLCPLKPAPHRPAPALAAAAQRQSLWAPRRTARAEAPV